MNDKKLVEFETQSYGAHVDLWYPPRDGPPTRVSVGLMDVRAADDITIEYDFERDGYVIRMDKTKDLGSMMDVVEEGVEVAFIPAWNEVESDAT